MVGSSKRQFARKSILGFAARSASKALRTHIQTWCQVHYRITLRNARLQHLRVFPHATRDVKINMNTKMPTKCDVEASADRLVARNCWTCFRFNVHTQTCRGGAKCEIRKTYTQSLLRRKTRKFRKGRLLHTYANSRLRNCPKGEAAGNVK